MDVGGRLLAALIASGDVILFRRLTLRPDFFLGPESPAYEFIAKHVESYNALPKPATLAGKFELPAAPEPVQFYADQVHQRYVHRRLNRTLVECSAMMKEMDTFGTRVLLQEALADVRMVEMRTSLAEFTADAHDLYMAEYLRRQTEEVIEIPFGWPHMDKYGGQGPGDVVTVVGRTSQGKSLALLYSAVHSAFERGNDELFVSTEMNMLATMERLVALYTHYPMDHIQNYELTTAQQKGLPALLLKAKGEKGRLWVMDGKLVSTVPQVRAVIRQLGVKSAKLDGAYLFKHEDKRLNKSQRVDANAEMIKEMAEEEGIPVWQSHQFNRDAAKKQKKSGGEDKGDLEDIGLSDSIGQLSSTVLGMFQESTVESLIKREMAVLKGRKGQLGKFWINFDWLGMNFTQIMDEELKKKGQLEFV